jgi:hypothetical protein
MVIYGRDLRSNMILGVSENEGTPPIWQWIFIGKMMISQWMEVSYFDAKRHGPARGSSEFSPANG